MIKTLYKQFQKWSKTGSVWIISDTHFDDADCKFMDPGWISPWQQVDIINEHCHKTDTLIHLGDIGNGEWLDKLKVGYKVLITGNHDNAKWYDKFDEVYTGPLFIGEKILLSHEPIYNLGFCMNIHGHQHNKGVPNGIYNYNVAANVHRYEPLNLGKFIKEGGLSKIDNIHRIIIDNARNKNTKQTQEIFINPFGEMTMTINGMEIIEGEYTEIC